MEQWSYLTGFSPHVVHLSKLYEGVQDEREQQGVGKDEHATEAKGCHENTED